MRNLSELLDIHQDLERIFFAHQRELLHFRFAESLRILEYYEDCLVKHVSDESDNLLAIYAERGKIAPGATVQMFLDDHEKLVNHITLFKEEIGNLPSVENIDERLIWILEREAFFKKLVDHHDIRETKFLYPELDRITTDAEKIELLSKMSVSFTIQ